MEKKIIAIVGVVLVLVSVFAACAKKPTIRGNNGMEYAVVTDDEGNTVLNEKGEVYVYVTDENGKYVKDSNGERQTNVIEFPRRIINGTTLETADYRITYPEGWKIDNIGRATPSSIEECYIDITNYGELENGETLAAYFAKEDEVVNELKNELKDVYKDITYNTSDQKVTDKQIDAKMGEFTMKNDKGETEYFSQTIYFIYNDNLYKVFFTRNNEGNDSNIDVLSIINENLVMK